MPKDIERVNTGIPGLDELIQGGFVKDNAVLLTGTSGTGKTIFCSQFLRQGLEEGDNCMFITFEERPGKIREISLDFGWDFEKYEEKGQLILKHKDPFEASEGEELFWFRDELEKHDIDRIALDSTSILSLYYEDPYEIRRSLFRLVRLLEESGITAVLTTEVEEGQDALTRFGVEEFLADGVIKLDILTMGGKAPRSLSIRKMRRTDIDTKSYGLRITNEGLKVSE